MGNSLICCCKRKDKVEKNYKKDNKNYKVTKKELKEMLIRTTKTMTKDQIILKIDEIRKSRNGDLIFTILMGGSVVITFIVICSTGVVEPNLVNGLFIGTGASSYYFSEVMDKNNLIDFYKEVLNNKI